MQNRGRFVFFAKQCLLLLFFLFVLNACGASHRVPTGDLQKNTEVLKIFRTATIVSDHTYYIQGVESNPDAIIGVKNSFQLRSKLWKRIDWNAKKLEKATFWMQSEEVGFCTANAGYLLLPDGEQFGIWYSRRERTVIKQPEANVVEIYPFNYIPSSACQRQQWADER